MKLEKKYQKAIDALKEISLGRGPYKMDHREHAVSTINAMKSEAHRTLVKLGEIEEEAEGNA